MSKPSVRNSSLTLAAAALLLGLMVLAPTTASANELYADDVSANDSSTNKLAVGLKVGGNWSLLTKPSDAFGEPTLLTGSAFDGAGFVGGATLHYPLTELEGAMLEFEGGLLFSRHSAEGFEEDGDTGDRRVITLQANMLRVPLMVHLRREANATGFRVGLGLEPMFGLQSGAVVDPGPHKLHTVPTIHVGTTVALGFDWQANDTFSVPLEFRATWDPFVASTTKERFENFSSSEDPGEYQVAYDWQLLFVTGIRYEL